MTCKPELAEYAELAKRYRPADVKHRIEHAMFLLYAPGEDKRRRDAAARLVTAAHRAAGALFGVRTTELSQDERDLVCAFAYYWYFDGVGTVRRCLRCYGGPEDHANGKCLYLPTEYREDP